MSTIWKTNISVIWWANTELTIDAEGAIKYGAKTQGIHRDSIGGWAYNRIVSLLNLGNTEIAPFLTLWEDSNGDTIVRSLQEKWLKISPERVKWLATPHSTIINNSEKGESAIMTKTNESFPFFFNFVRSKIDTIFSTPYLVITHVHWEQKDDSVVKELIQKSPLDSNIFTNFGRTQISFGLEYWKDIIDEKISIFQLNLEEAKTFFWCADISEIIQYIKNNFKKTNFLITLWEDWNCIITPSGSIHVQYKLDFRPKICTTNWAWDVFWSAFLDQTIKKWGPNNLDCLTSSLLFATNTALNHCLGNKKDIDYMSHFNSGKV